MTKAALSHLRFGGKFLIAHMDRVAAAKMLKSGYEYNIIQTVIDHIDSTMYNPSIR